MTDTTIFDDLECDYIENGNKRKALFVADGELDLQLAGSSQTIHVEVFGPFGVHQDRETHLWCITLLHNRKRVSNDWSLREMAILFIRGLRILPIRWVDVPDFYPFTRGVREIRAAIWAMYAAKAEAEARGHEMTQAEISRVAEDAARQRAIKDARVEARTRWARGAPRPSRHDSRT